MNVALWHQICSLRAESGKLLDRTMLLGGAGSGDQAMTRSPGRLAASGPARTALASRTRFAASEPARTVFAEKIRGASDGKATAPATVAPELLQRLREDLLGHLEILEEQLGKELTEGEVQLVLFPLVLLCDEMVMVRLPKEQHTQWHLLQSDLFSINYGGDVFYEFTDEQLAKSDPPGLVFAVLYYCLACGFAGRFGLDTGKVRRYKGLLSERITQAAQLVTPALTTPSEPAPRRRRRGLGAMASEERPVRLRLSLWALALAMLLIVGFVLLSNP